MTEAERVVDLRLKALEELVPAIRTTERDTDLLKISVMRYEADQAAAITASAARDEQLHSSLTRLHQRLDELSADEHREQGARAERSRLGKWIITAVVTSSAAAGAIVGVLSLVINNG